MDFLSLIATDVAKTMLVLSALFLVRNNVTFRVRMRILHERGVEVFERLPTYLTMLINPKFYLLWTTEHWLAWLQRHHNPPTSK